MKYHLFLVLGNAQFTYEELNTILVQVEAYLNSRALTSLSSDPTELTPLTLGHFLTGSAIKSIPEPDLSGISINRLDRWQRVVQASQKIWFRWSK